jgi:uncharacterized tellurite resistance protein B-like protein
MSEYHFRSESNDDELKRQFQNSFTQIQKIAIMGSLISMAFADGEGSDDEAEIAAIAADLLGLDLKEKDVNSYMDDPLYYLEQLKTLTDEQKKWYVRLLHLMIVADGKIEIRELDKLLEFLEVIGIDEATYKRYMSED